MPGFDSLYIDIKKIKLAHEFVLNKKNKCVYPDGREYYGIVYCIAGSAGYKFSSGESCELNAGDIILLPPTAAYSIVTKKEFVHYTINFEIHKEFSDVDFLKDTYYLLHSENQQMYHHLFKNTVSQWAGKKSCFEMRATACLYELLSILSAEILQKEKSATSYLRLNPAKEYIEQNYNLKMSLDMLANLVNMSVTNFRREWIKTYGETAFQYREKVCLSYAKDYLASGFYTVGEVASKCGFDDVNYFIRFFKKHTGISPGKFKKV